MNEFNIRRKSLDSKMKNRASDSSFRIHLQSTKAICRNKSLTTTDSLKLYEDQIVLKNPILDGVNESSLQKRPLSLCFDLGSSSEDINTTDTSSTMSSSSSSSSNSKSFNSSINEHDPFPEDDNFKGNNSHSLCEEYNVDSDRYCTSNESSTKESIITVINHKNSKSSESNSLQICTINDNNPKKDKYQSYLEQSYDLSSSDNIDYAKIDFLESDMKYIKLSDIDDIKEIQKFFNMNSSGMKMIEDDDSLICTVKIFINLTEPVKMSFPDAVISSCKTLFPRGGFELVNIDKTSTCKDIIEHLFEKFHIHENYSSYGVFEHTINDGQKVLVKRLEYDYLLLGYLVDLVRLERHNFYDCISTKRFVLQENERVQINWSKFSTSELSNFLRILEREEKDRRQKIIQYYSDLESMIKYQMNLTSD